METDARVFCGRADIIYAKGSVTYKGRQVGRSCPSWLAVVGGRCALNGEACMGPLLYYVLMKRAKGPNTFRVKGLQETTPPPMSLVATRRQTGRPSVTLGRVAATPALLSLCRQAHSHHA